MEETGRLEPKQEEVMLAVGVVGVVVGVVVVVVEEEREVIVSIVGAGNVGSQEEVIVAVAVGVVVEEEMEVMVTIVGAGNVGSHIMESMGSMGDDRIIVLLSFKL